MITDQQNIFTNSRVFVRSTSMVKNVFFPVDFEKYPNKFEYSTVDNSSNYLILLWFDIRSI